jgi:hypothetical protein
MWRPIKMIEEWTPTGPDVAIVTNNSILPFFTEQSLLYDGFVPLQARSCSPRSPALIILITSRHVRINFFSLQLVSEIRIKSQLGLSNRSGRHILNSSGHFWGLVPFFFLSTQRGTWLNVFSRQVATLLSKLNTICVGKLIFYSSFMHYWLCVAWKLPSLFCTHMKSNIAHM